MQVFYAQDVVINNFMKLRPADFFQDMKFPLIEDLLLSPTFVRCPDWRAEMGMDMSEPTVVWVDNSGAVELASRRDSTQRSRHIDRRYLWIREKVMEEHI